MKREDLEKLDFTDSKAAIDAIMALNGKDIEKEKKALEPLQAQITTLTGENETIKGQLTEAGATIEKFKSMDIDAIKKTADDYKLASENAQAEIKKTKEEAANQIAAKDFEYKLNDAIVAAKAKDAPSVLAHLNRNDLKLGSDGTIVGLDAQIAKIKTERDYLFTNEKTPPPPSVLQSTPATTIPVGGAVAWKAAGLPEPTTTK